MLEGVTALALNLTLNMYLSQCGIKGTQLKSTDFHQNEIREIFKTKFGFKY